MFDEATELIADFRRRGGEFADFGERLDDAFYGNSSTEIMVQLSFALIGIEKSLTHEPLLRKRVSELSQQLLAILKRTGIH